MIKPILDEKCVSCHGEASVKGGLLLDNINEMIRGGKTGPLFIPGKPEMSLLIKRIHMSKEEKKRMPPISKPQLADDEIALLDAWIKSGALINKKLITLPVQDSFRMLASRFLGPTDEAENISEYQFPPADNKKIAALNNNYRVIEPHGKNSPALTVYFYGKNMYTSKALEEVLTLKQQITEISLARMPVKDEDLKIISQFPNLRKLNLNYTDITHKGLAELNASKNLQSLALAGTNITLQSLEKLSSLPQLTSVYIWDTPVDSLQIAGMRNRFKKMRIETGFVDNGQMLIPLSPPVFKTPSGIVDQPVQVEMKHPFKDVDIRYTLDGTMPDSINSELYKKPIEINDNMVFIARAFKQGWYGSPATQKSYIKKGVKPDSVELITPPDLKYKSVAASIVTDGDLADLNVNNGQWLGYQKNEAGYYLYFNNAVIIENVLVNMLKNTGSHIFPPLKLEVWGGMDKDQLKPLGTIIPEMPKKHEAAVMILEKIKIAPTQARVIKISAKPLNRLPEWHKEKGKQGWVFVSEIVVN